MIFKDALKSFAVKVKEPRHKKAKEEEAAKEDAAKEVTAKKVPFKLKCSGFIVFYLLD